MRHAEPGAAGEEAVSAATQLPGFISSLRVWLCSEAVTQKSWGGWSRSVCEEQEWRRGGGTVPAQGSHLLNCFLSDYTGVGIAGSREELSKTSHAVCNGLEQPRKQQRSDLNGPIDNNNAPETKKVSSFPSFVDVPGPCEPEDLIDGIIFAANYLGSTQLLSERNPSKNIRMMQAQEAVSRVKRMQKAAKIKKKATSEGDSQALTEVDLFISTQRIKVLNADTQETMMDHALRTISYIADIGNIVVLMARRRMPRSASQDCIETTPGAQEGKKQYKMICHVFESEDAQLIAQSIGQAFSVAYQEFLRANGINPEDLSQKEYSDIINTQEMYNDDLIHFSNSENCKELQLEKQKGEILGVVIVESGWGSILPTVILANMMNGGPAARSGKLSIGDQIMSINGTSLVGLPLATCQGIIKGLKNQTQVKLNIVSCPPVTTVLIKRPDLKYQLGFSVQNGIICSLMRGGIAERGGVRVGHRIIEINGQSVVATAHEKIVQALSNSVGEIHMKTMPAAMFRLLTGQETPLYI
ncbi:amyloid-beta A4 precursor protein-binding family A member 2 isoform X4 [Dermochelys coriacea]|uniref:amyloid-beta A4 precursor protein-binding family A member 2 isoform X4 n=1 Tax=Dermochelys coriacea TaxID=27794 RepID=UPI001CA7F2C7|nr:amyloid-beta A4 precursor protein-binding family A member 2 isoform X4 [Dermochelys coriacea]